MKTHNRKSTNSSKTRANAPSESTPWHRRIQAGVATGYATRILPAAEALFEAGGKKLLPKAMKEAVQELTKKAAPEVLEAGVEAVKTTVKSSGATVVSSAKVIARGAAKSSAWGAAIDLGVSGFQGIRGVLNDEMTGKQALVLVAKETGKGAVANVAGTLAAAGLVALTGPISLPVAVGVTFAATLGTRAALDALDTQRVVINAADVPTGTDRVSSESPALSS